MPPAIEVKYTKLGSTDQYVGKVTVNDDVVIRAFVNKIISLIMDAAANGETEYTFEFPPATDGLIRDLVISRLNEVGYLFVQTGHNGPKHNQWRVLFGG